MESVGLQAPFFVLKKLLRILPLAYRRVMLYYNS